jgi:demethylmenaquinone methyltransferase/2-methoxy-6-polyprenyl-1,4-benzoquinol methylase
MFNNIAFRYDFLNHFLSAGIDKIWRKKAINILKKHNPKQILDIATGTGDFAIAALDLQPEKVIGIDISEGMLKVGIEKLKKRKLDAIIELQLGDSENLEFAENTFDALTAGFGVRYFQDLDAGLREMHRVLKPKGIAVILEFSQPERFPIKQLYRFYFYRILPFFGKIVSKDSSAYTYLPESVGVFPYGKKFLQRMENAGFYNLKMKTLAFGIASIYTGEKK